MTDQVYDGFISYSHAADGLLAPRLRSDELVSSGLTKR